MLIGGCDGYLAALSGRRLGGILYQIEKNLDQTVLVAMDRRQLGPITTESLSGPG